jgi:hypothetical protein
VGASVATSVGTSVITSVGASVATGVGVSAGPQAARIIEATINATITKYSFFMYFFSSLKMETSV